jgi:hypothetical protein
MESVIVDVNSGICGFKCRINAERSEKRDVRIEITESDCGLIQKYSKLLNDISLKDLFTPLTKNLIFVSAEQAGCHQACPVPVAVIKACEVAFEMALPKNADICFIK